MSEEPYEIILCNVCEKPLLKKFEKRVEIVNPYHEVTIITINKFDYGYEDIKAYLCDDCYRDFNNLKAEIFGKLRQKAVVYDIEGVDYIDLFVWSIESLFRLVEGKDISKPKEGSMYMYKYHRWFHGIEIHMISPIGIMRLLLPYTVLLNELKLRIRKKIGKNEGL